jgi:hypothetical protein
VTAIEANGGLAGAASRREARAVQRQPAGNRDLAEDSPLSSLVQPTARTQATEPVGRPGSSTAVAGAVRAPAAAVAAFVHDAAPGPGRCGAAVPVTRGPRDAPLFRRHGGGTGFVGRAFRDDDATNRALQAGSACGSKRRLCKLQEINTRYFQAVATSSVSRIDCSGTPLSISEYNNVSRSVFSEVE